MRSSFACNNIHHVQKLNTQLFGFSFHVICFTYLRMQPIRRKYTIFIRDDRISEVILYATPTISTNTPL